MRGLGFVLLAAAIGAAPASAFAEGKIRLAQTSNVTNCMMICNSAAANCRTTCLVPGTPPTTAATTTSNSSANVACLLNCTSTQQTCHTACGQQSPSR